MMHISHKARSSFPPAILIASDIASLLFAVSVSYLTTSLISPQLTGWNYPTIEQATAGRWISFLFSTLALLYIIETKQHYSGKKSFWSEAQELAPALTFCFLLEGFIQYFWKDETSRIWMALTWSLAYPTILFSRKIIKKITLKERGRIRTFVFGHANETSKLVSTLEQDETLGYEIVGTSSNLDPERMLHTIRTIGADQAIISLTEIDRAKITAVSNILNENKINFSFTVPHVGQMSTDTILGHDVIIMNQKSGLLNPIKRLAKRITDIFVSLSALVALSPIILIVAYLVRKDGGPAFYGHSRVGVDGKTFKCWKFRSMAVDSEVRLKKLLETNQEAREEWEKSRKLKIDPRVTKLGQVIRSTAIDEIPQLWNVLKGEMSLVGPRPVTEDEINEYYGEGGKKMYCKVRPGVTGLWQASGRNNINYERRVEMDAWYVRNWSPWIDLVIVCKTIPTLLKRTGAS